MTVKAKFTDINHSYIGIEVGEGETFASLIGPTSAFITISPGNREFDALFPDAITDVDLETGAPIIVDLGTPAISIAPFEPPPAPPVVLFKVDFYRRLTDEEAEAVEQTIGQQPIRQRRIFESANSFRSDAPEWQTLDGLAIGLFGAARAAELLQPSE